MKMVTKKSRLENKVAQRFDVSKNKDLKFIQPRLVLGSTKFIEAAEAAAALYLLVLSLFMLCVVFHLFGYVLKWKSNI